MLFNDYTSYSPIEEASQEIVYTPEMIPVVKMDEGFYTEMNFLAPYMESAGIEYVEDAIDNVAFAHGLDEGAVGLLIDSDCSDAVYEMACALSEAGIPVAYKCLDEARTAEEYRKQKTKAQNAEQRAQDKRDKNRYIRGSVNDFNGVKGKNRNGRSASDAFKTSKNNFMNRTTSGASTDSDHFVPTSSDIRNLNKDLRTAQKNRDFKYAQDSIDRHNRRHPNNKVAGSDVTGIRNTGKVKGNVANYEKNGDLLKTNKTGVRYEPQLKFKYYEGVQNLREFYNDDFDAYMND